MSTKVKLTPTEEKFVREVWRCYRTAGRHDLPWRQSSNLSPYRVLVSEIMLQQTQVARVIPKYQLFIMQWGSARALARAPLADVLRAWQGLGYNRRAKALWECAREVNKKRNGRFPKTAAELQKRPGIGPYTAGAVLVFSYNEPAVLLETNIRTVFIHHFFKEQETVSDTEIRPIIERMIDHDQPRQWYWALMDYGAHLKRAYGNSNVRSRHYVKQSRFVGSDRQIRGAIVRVLAAYAEPVSRADIRQKLANHDHARIAKQLTTLQEEGMVIEHRGRFGLPN